MIKDTLIDLPLVNQRTNTRNKKWAHRTCAICSLKMILSWKNPKLSKIKIMNFVKLGLRMNGYINGIGWKHQVLVDIALKHRLKLKRKFVKTRKEKLKLLSKIEKEIENRRPVMASMFHKLNRKNGGHIVVINGIRKNDNRIIGYFIKDPDPLFRGNNYFVTQKEFFKGWRGGMLWLS